MCRPTSERARGSAPLLLALALTGLSYSAKASADEGGASVVNATKAQKAKASQAYHKALEAIEEKKYEDALVLLDESFNTVASPNSLLLKARALTQLGRNVEAYRQLETAVALAEDLAKADEKYAQTAESGRKELAEVSKKLALVTVKPAASVELGDKAVDANAWNHPQPYEPGKLKVTVKHEGGQAATQQLDLSAGESVEVSTAPPPPDSVSRHEAPAPAAAVASAPAADDVVSKRTLAYVSGAIGVVGAGTFVAFTLLSDNPDAHDGCNGELCSAASLDIAEQNATNKTLGFVGLGVGIVGLATGAYLFVTSGDSGPAEQPVTDVAIGPGRVMVRGTF